MLHPEGQQKEGFRGLSIGPLDISMVYQWGGTDIWPRSSGFYADRGYHRDHDQKGQKWPRGFRDCHIVRRRDRTFL